MVNPRQLDFPDDTSPSSPSLSLRKSPRKHTSSKPSSPPAEPEAEQPTTKKKKKNKKQGSSVINRIWNEEDELTVLKGLVGYQAKTGLEPKSNWDDFYRFLEGSITARFSKEQLLSKIRKLKGRFLGRMQKISQGDDHIVAGTSKAEAFRLSSRIWGQNDSEAAKNDSESANHSKSGEEACKEGEELANHEPLNENGVAKSDFEGNDGDVSCALTDAFETTMARGLTDYQKKSQLEKLMSLGSGKRKELSDEWKELCSEEVKLNIKRFRFSAMLAEAANGR